jgi:hypothetical protein
MVGKWVAIFARVDSYASVVWFWFLADSGSRVNYWKRRLPNPKFSRGFFF